MPLCTRTSCNTGPTSSLPLPPHPTTRGANSHAADPRIANDRPVHKMRHGLLNQSLAPPHCYRAWRTTPMFPSCRRRGSPRPARPPAPRRLHACSETRPVQNLMYHPARSPADPAMLQRYDSPMLRVRYERTDATPSRRLAPPGGLLNNSWAGARHHPPADIGPAAPRILRFASQPPRYLSRNTAPARPPLASPPPPPKGRDLRPGPPFGELHSASLLQTAYSTSSHTPFARVNPDLQWMVFLHGPRPVSHVTPPGTLPSWPARPPRPPTPDPAWSPTLR